MNQGVFVFPHIVHFPFDKVKGCVLVNEDSQKMSVCILTWCRRGVKVHLLTVLPVARLVAASHPQHVHAVHLQPVNHCAASTHFIQSLPPPASSCQPSSKPASGRSSWYHTPTAILHREVPSWRRVRGESPA